jgi:putative transposase
MTRIAVLIRTRKGRTATPSMVMIDGQTVRGGRGGRTNGAKRSVVIEILGLPLALSVESARPHDVSAGRRLLDTTCRPSARSEPSSRTGATGASARWPPSAASTSTSRPRRRGRSASRRSRRSTAFEHAFGRLGRWRRLSRCYEGTPESARAWLEVAALAYLFARLRAEPA